MTSRAGFDRAMAASPAETDRILALGALPSSATHDDLIVVGGSAVYLRAPELAPSLDVDLVTRIRPAASKVLESWGFGSTRAGRPCAPRDPLPPLIGIRSGSLPRRLPSCTPIEPD